MAQRRIVLFTCLHAILYGNMAAMSFSPVSLRPPELSAATSNHRSAAASLPRRRPLSISFASASPETSTAPPGKPEIELEFLGVHIILSQIFIVIIMNISSFSNLSLFLLISTSIFQSIWRFLRQLPNWLMKNLKIVILDSYVYVLILA